MTLRNALVKALEWFERMVDTQTMRFYYVCRAGGKRVHEESPIRDMATVYDVARLLNCLNIKSPLLEGAMMHTTRWYINNCIQIGTDGMARWTYLPKGERPTIAHSAMLILAIESTRSNAWPQEHLNGMVAMNDGLT